ncbi:pseudouridine synthase [Spirochaeta africana]|uniref:Pseudouridine synthase n=1 Tax=Spirochaeta africana (strain ATCC 700263 / DSM 8902 / Z-7692) TaxID=889378 RepID=H9UJ83_SPIAZ|nr:pseudouridine synthase [Spirochaeta africana]AFG37576.1 pseudouridine synthase family protein [Spirochaeta africana DSM 8902]
MDDKNIRLQVYLARAGIASRRKCEDIIAQGRVQVNGTVIRTMGVKVGPEDTVSVDGRPVRHEERKVYLAVHKPRGMLCSNYDPDKRPLLMDLLKQSFTERLFTVGRLDFLSSGLILVTNDGEFAKVVSHPSSQVEKEYLVETKRPIPVELLERWKKSGIPFEGGRYNLIRYTIKHDRAVYLVLNEGKNREIRNVFAAANIAVSRVHRLRIGPIVSKGLHPGHWRSLKPHEVKELMKTGRNRGSRN